MVNIEFIVNTFNDFIKQQRKEKEIEAKSFLTPLCSLKVNAIAPAYKDIKCEIWLIVSSTKKYKIISFEEIFNFSKVTKDEAFEIITKLLMEKLFNLLIDTKKINKIIEEDL